MEEHFLNDFIGQFGKDAKLGSHKDQTHLWYNQDGDCIQFQTTDVAIVADRIDEYLTIYRSAENNEPVGFQLKDIKALIKKYGLAGISVEATVRDNKLISVTALLLRAFGALTPSINRNEGYATAFRALPKEEDAIAVPV